MHASSAQLTRRPAVAGRFYPADPVALRRAVRSYIDDATCDHQPGRIVAMIAPHAGYPYSGPIAGTAYALLRDVGRPIRRVILIGPAHRVAFSGIAATSAAAFDTPLGPVTVDQQTVRRLTALPSVHVVDQAHGPEHSLEVQLPFLIEALHRDNADNVGFSVVPLLVGDATADQVAELLNAAWPAGDVETFVVVSSDLSHYLDYPTARALDEATTEAIEQLAPQRLGHEQACGRVPIAGLLQVAQQRKLKVITVDLRNSGDTAGPRDQVVGYGAYVFTE